MFDKEKIAIDDEIKLFYLLYESQNEHSFTKNPILIYISLYDALCSKGRCCTGKGSYTNKKI